MENSLQSGNEFVVIGANHRSSTMLFRDQLAMSGNDLTTFYKRLLELNSLQSVVLSGPNRTEVFAFYKNIDNPAGEIIRLLSAHAGIPRSEIQAQTYQLHNQDGIKHLFSLCCGLDSLVIGDQQERDHLVISHDQAKHFGISGEDLDFFILKALDLSKRIFKETNINRYPVSIPAACVRVARELHGDLSQCSGLLIGDCEMGKMLTSALLSSNLSKLLVAHPVIKKAEMLGNYFNCHVATLDELVTNLTKADVIITSVNSRKFFLTYESIHSALKLRHRKPFLLIDTGLPGDVDHTTNRLEDAFLYTLDDLEKVTRKNVENREIETEMAWKIINSEINNDSIMYFPSSLNSI